MKDEVAGDDCDWSLGCFVGAKILGPAASPDAYGHGGSQSSIAWVDPDAGLAAVIFLNGRPGPAAHRERVLSLCSKLYEDLADLGVCV